MAEQQRREQKEKKGSEAHDGEGEDGKAKKPKDPFAKPTAADKKAENKEKKEGKTDEKKGPRPPHEEKKQQQPAGQPRPGPAGAEDADSAGLGLEPVIPTAAPGDADDDKDESGGKEEDGKGRKKKQTYFSPVLSDGRFAFVVMPKDKKAGDRLELAVHALDPEATARLEHCHSVTLRGGLPKPNTVLSMDPTASKKKKKKDKKKPTAAPAVNRRGRHRPQDAGRRS